MSKKGNKYNSGIDIEEGGKFGLGRAFYLDNYFNRMAIACSAIIAAAMFFYKDFSGTGTGDIIHDGISYAIGFFFSYLIAAEADPEPSRAFSGILAGFATLIGQIIVGADENSVVALLWMLFMLRMFNRSSGSRHRIGDNLIILGSAFWMGHLGYWLFPVATGFGYIMESQIKEGYSRSLFLSAFAFAIVLLTDKPMPDPVINITYLYMMAAAFILFLPEFTVARISTAKGDRNNRLLIPTRIQVAQAFFLIGTDILVWFGGNAVGMIMLPCITTAIACGLFLLFALIRDKSKEKK